MGFIESILIGSFGLLILSILVLEIWSNFFFKKVEKDYLEGLPHGPRR